MEIPLYFMVCFKVTNQSTIKKIEFYNCIKCVYKNIFSYIAIQENKVDVVELLLKHGAQIQHERGTGYILFV